MITNFEKNLYNSLKDKYDLGEHHVRFDIPKSEKDKKELVIAMEHLEQDDYILFIETPDDGYNHYLVELSPKGAFSEKL